MLVENEILEVKIAGSCIQKGVKQYLNATLVKKHLKTKINFYTTEKRIIKNLFKPVKMWIQVNANMEMENVGSAMVIQKIL